MDRGVTSRLQFVVIMLTSLHPFCQQQIVELPTNCTHRHCHRLHQTYKFSGGRGWCINGRAYTAFSAIRRSTYSLQKRIINDCSPRAVCLSSSSLAVRLDGRRRTVAEAAWSILFSADDISSVYSSSPFVFRDRDNTNNRRLSSCHSYFDTWQLSLKTQRPPRALFLRQRHSSMPLTS